MYRKILLPVDGSPGSERAIDYALDMAEKHGAAIHVMHVVDTRMFSEPGLSSMELVTDEAEDWAHDLIDEVCETAEARGLTVETCCCHGVPHDEIVAYADEVDVDAIVLGYRGTSNQPAIGSVAERVLRATDRPVLTV